MPVFAYFLHPVAALSLTQETLPKLKSTLLLYSFESSPTGKDRDIAEKIYIPINWSGTHQYPSLVSGDNVKVVTSP